LYPHTSFCFSIAKRVVNKSVNSKFRSGVSPWYYHNIIRFVESLTGKRALLQFYPFMAQQVSKEAIVRYKLWMPRMAYYERKLGHRFFLEEAIHILHLGFVLRDPVVISQ